MNSEHRQYLLDLVERLQSDEPSRAVVLDARLDLMREKYDDLYRQCVRELGQDVVDRILSPMWRMT